MPDEVNDNVNKSSSLPEGEDASTQVPEQIESEVLTAKIAELENVVNRYKDQLLRKAAEFENYKKRIENDFSAISRFANENLILKFLQVLDDVERSMKAFQQAKNEQESSTGNNDDAFVKGMELIYNKFKKILETQGVTSFEVVGKPFDPQLHDALMQMPRTGVPPHTIIEEVEKGYMMHDKVIRHAKVVVSTEVSNDVKQLSEGNDAN